MLNKCKTCKRWEHLNSKGYCPDCSKDHTDNTDKSDSQTALMWIDNDGLHLEFGDEK